MVILAHRRKAFVSGTESYNTLALDGSTQYLTIADDASIDLGSADFGLSFWLNWGGSVANTYFATKGDNGGSQQSYRIQLSTGLFRFSYSTNGTSYTDLNSASISWSTNTWYHLVVRRNGSDLEFYVDNVLKDTATISGTLHASSDDLAIGRLLNYAPLHFAGNFHSFGLHTAITTGNISEMYNGGIGLEYADMTTGLQNTYAMMLPLHDGDLAPYDDNASTNDSTASGSPSITTPTMEFSA